MCSVTRSGTIAGSTSASHGSRTQPLNVKYFRLTLEAYLKASVIHPEDSPREGRLDQFPALTEPIPIGPKVSLRFL